MSAHIIQLPTAAVSPVIQRSRRGPLPKAVLSIRKEIEARSARRNYLNGIRERLALTERYIESLQSEARFDAYFLAKYRESDSSWNVTPYGFVFDRRRRGVAS